MKKKRILFLYLFLFSLSSFAQDLEVDEDYVSEFIYGINFNTNAGLIGGVYLKTSKIIKPRQYRTLGLEIVHIKNSKEYKDASPSFSNLFVVYKTNYFYSFRPQYGRDFILFKKNPEEGVQVSAVFAAGPSVGVQLPYHILYQYPNSNVIVSEQYDPTKHTNFNAIAGPGGIFDGIANTELILGINAKAGLSLDFSPFGNAVTGIEAGFTIEGFSGKPLILSDSPSGDRVNQPNIFSAVYLTFFFGSRR